MPKRRRDFSGKPNYREAGKRRNVQQTESRIATPAGPPSGPPSAKSGAIFVLNNASLTKGYVGKKEKILSSPEDDAFLLREGKNVSDHRPDIVFEALRGILDSALNKAGLVQAVYVKTGSGLLLEVNPHLRIPRSCKRFNGLMLELLEKACVRAGDSQEILIRIVKEPLSSYIPQNSRIIGLSYSSTKSVDIEDYVSAFNDDVNLVFVVGAMAHGRVNSEGTDDYISVSDYPLSAKCCIGIICEALEQKWKVPQMFLKSTVEQKLS